MVIVLNRYGIICIFNPPQILPFGKRLNSIFYQNVRTSIFILELGTRIPEISLSLKKQKPLRKKRRSNAEAMSAQLSGREGFKCGCDPYGVGDGRGVDVPPGSGDPGLWDGIPPGCSERKFSAWWAIWQWSNPSGSRPSLYPYSAREGEPKNKKVLVSSLESLITINYF